MSEIRFIISGERVLDYIDWELQCAMYEENMTPRQQMRLCMAFLVNDAGEYYEPEEAKQILGKLTLRQKGEASSKLVSMINGLGQTSQPPLASQTGAPLSTSTITQAPPA